MTNSTPSSSDDEKHRQERWLAIFTAVSETLLDQRPLPMDAARVYLQIVLRATPDHYAPGDYYVGPLANPSLDPHPLDVLGAVYERLAAEAPHELEARLMALTGADVTLQALVRNILIVWFNGCLGTDIAPADVYAEALVWQAIGANPPGLPGPYYGHWGYPGPSPIRDPMLIDAAASLSAAAEASNKHEQTASSSIPPTPLYSHVQRRR